jgi:hypothetical protein
VNGRQRKVVFASAAAVLVASAVFVALLVPRSAPVGDARRAWPVGTTEIQSEPSPNDAAKQGGRRAEGPSPAPGPSSAPSPAHFTQGEREANGAPAVVPDQAALAQRAARTFLVGYLPYSYGRARAERIQAATGRLLHELQRAPPRVLPALARADPRLISVHADATLGDLAINVVAVVDDGQRRYRVPLELRRARGRWVVTAVGG